jgi:type II restriction/modification system DNA methylase subunit YeeA
MNITQIEQNLKDLIDSFDKDEFIYDLLLAYGRPKASITRLKSGNLNLSSAESEVSWKKQLFFKEEYSADLHLTVSELVKTIKNDQRFVIVTDYETLLAVDTKTLDKLDIKLTDLPKHYDFFLPWAGMEKTQHQDENPADVKAAEKMAKLFDKIKEDNPDDSPEFIHGLNVFLSRILFCLFAEDTNIFTANQFISNIDSHTQKDGSDLQSYLKNLFKVLNTPESQRYGLPDYLKEFPYVNGELFSKEHQIPVFKAKSRQAIIDSGMLDWSGINPDIFGSMFQAVVDKGERGSLGMHYTSVPNIMKVIKPLFLDDLYEEFDKSIGNNKKLIKLADRLSKIKIFDPACGSGNFLIIAFKHLKRLEMEIFKELSSFTFSQITPSQFYGIEIDDFAHEIAKLSLWLTEHQMNIEFFDEFQRVNPTLPLKKAGNITCANATRIDWKEVCPKEQDNEIYVLGNPPYLGSRYQEDVHREDIGFILHKIKGYKRLDYITIWFYKGADYIKGINSKLAFVTTNSITQGEQVVSFWPYVLSDNIEISFAYTSFKWMNNAKGNAGVTVAIIGLQNNTNNQKYLYSNNSVLTAKNVNPYLTTANNVFIQKRSTPLSYKEKIERTNPALDNGFFLLNENEKQSLVLDYPQSEKLVKLVVGAAEFLRGINKYCLWINDEDLGLAESIPPINERIEKVREYRLKRKNTASNNPADFPHRFLKMKLAKKQVLFLPTVSSERRRYIPVGFLDEDTVIIDPNFAIYDPEIYIMSIVSSRMHMTWVRTIAGRLKTDYRYSSTLVYNTFPFPNVNEKQKEELNQHVFNILGEREKHPEKTLAQLYDPDKMPDGLREAHHKNDLAIERCYRSKPFENDEERLEYLFKLYEKMIAEEEAH